MEGCFKEKPQRANDPTNHGKTFEKPKSRENNYPVLSLETLKYNLLANQTKSFPYKEMPRDFELDMTDFVAIKNTELHFQHTKNHPDYKTKGFSVFIFEYANSTDVTLYFDLFNKFYLQENQLPHLVKKEVDYKMDVLSLSSKDYNYLKPYKNHLVFVTGTCSLTPEEWKNILQQFQNEISTAINCGCGFNCEKN
ncbi:MAG: hypothetical protein C4K58_00615 [Flavobacteriaceae bacterium]|nr:MAG: hypothetical protein C4K58_00615 [Flavobacteriaceae bacterium]